MEKDIGKVRKNADTDILIRVDDFGGKPGVTIREYVNGTGMSKYKGFTKSGTRISLEEFPNFKDLINSIKIEDLDFSNSTPKMPSPNKFTPKQTDSSKPKKEEKFDEDYGSDSSGEEFY